MRTISNWLLRISSAKVAGTAALVFILFSAFALPAQARLTEERLKGAAAPDTSFFYSSSDLRTMAEAYGPDGRQAYIHARFTFDIAWPIIYMAFLATTISLLIARSGLAHSAWHWMNLLPVLAAGFDLFENVLTSLVMGRFPREAALSAALAPWASMIKWLLLAASFLALAGFALNFLRQRISSHERGK